MNDSSELARSAQPAIEVESLSDTLAVVTMRGEYDLSTAVALSDAMEAAAARPCVLIDMSDCTFLDSTALARLLSAHRKQIARDGRFEVVIPSSAQAVQRIIKLCRIDALVTIRESRSAGFASLDAQADAT